MSGSAGPAQRADKWLWHARMFRTRSHAARFATSGKLRINGTRIVKASHPVALGDVLTFALGGRVRVIKVAGYAARRGPYADACELYEDLSPPAPAREEATVVAPGAGERISGAGRPTKRDRRDIASFTTPCD